MEPVLQFKSHVEGKNADVHVYRDRIEWSQGKGISGAKATAALLTAGASAVATGLRKKHGDYEVLPVKGISSIRVEKDGLRFSKVLVATSTGVIGFRVGHDEAKSIAGQLTQLMTGSHPAQQVAAADPTINVVVAHAPAATPAPPPPQVVGSSIAPAPPGTPAGWVADPSGCHELRYWDGGRWTEYVSDAGMQSTDAI